MAPNRYGPQHVAPYGILTPSWLQQNHQAQQPHTGLPPPTSGNNGFGPGSAASNASPFAMAGAMNNGGFDRGLSDAPNFTRGGNLAQSHARDFVMNPREPVESELRIRDVWKGNLHSEMQALRQLVEKYPYIAMDTEFPGIVARPIGQFTTKSDYHYQTLRCNVDLLKMIQLGITLFAPDGSLPPVQADSNSKVLSHPFGFVPAPCTWQFNFKFSLSTDMYAAESTSMLSKAGIAFDRHETSGIDPQEFGALLISSGLVLDEDVHWISFHSGYDFAYLMKMMICKPLPDDENEFHDLVTKFFPSLYDIKFMLKHAGAKGTVNNNQPLTQEAQQLISRIAIKSGLQDIAEELNVARIGQAHQAGSDSLLTGQVYFKMREKMFGGHIDEEKYSGQVWGLNAQLPGTGAGSRDLSTPNMNGATFYSQNGTPSTPQTGAAGIAGGQAHTPQPQSNPVAAGLGAGGGTLTPGGQFGNFQYRAMA